MIPDVAPTPPAQEVEPFEPALVSYALDFSTCTLSFADKEMYFNRDHPQSNGLRTEANGLIRRVRELEAEVERLKGEWWVPNSGDIK